MSDLTKFKVVLDSEGWDEYKKQVVLELLNLDESSTFELATAPKDYPCLVASIVISKTDVRCCFVYPDDAVSLLEHTIDVEDNYTFEDRKEDKDVKLEDSNAKKMEINPLLLGMYLELEAIGAIKPDKVLNAMKFCHEHMREVSSASGKAVFETFEDFLSELSKEYNAR